ncbi:MAG: class II glutamine amidotransferase [Candidatus Cryosericum sp.]
MCRMFGLIAETPQFLAPWLTDEEPSLRSLAIKDRSGEGNVDGWGVGWYDRGGDNPHIVKEPKPAYESPLYEETARSVSARIALAHVRRSSGTPRLMENTHPFGWGRWLFCHNGYCSGTRLKDRLLPRYKNILKGENDSEIYFALLLQYLEAMEDPVTALGTAVHEVMSVGEFTGLNFLLSEGLHIYAFHYSTDPERHSMYVQHNADSELVASEPLGLGDWEGLPNGSLAVLEPGAHTVVALV